MEQSPESIIPPEVYEANLSEGWDSVSQGEIFLDEIKKMPFYRPGLLYSGFNADDIGKNSSDVEKGVVFCATEKEILEAITTQNPISYASEQDNPAIGVYDPDKLSLYDVGFGYVVTDPTALLAVVKLNFEGK